MSRSYDVIVIGLGGMGSAAAYRLARRGRRVLGLERFGRAHDRGASHGGSRIYRQGYAEGPQYVPLLLRARELWDQLGHDAGEEVFTQTGGIMIGRADSTMVAGSLRSARQWDLPHELLDATAIRRRFPTLTPTDEDVAFYEQQAGVARPELTVAAHLRLAERHGAELRFHHPARGWEADPGGGVRVTTADGGTVTADRLVVAPGAWAPQLLPGLEVPVRVERRVMFWFAPFGGTSAFDIAHHPIYVWEGPDGEVYGFPALDGPSGGAKVGFHAVGVPANPDRLDRGIDPSEVEAMRAFLRPRIPALAGRFLKGAACTYTLTPDGHPVISPHPELPQVIIACGFSGHGFKFVPVVGEILADLAVDGTTRHPLAPFSARR